MERISGNDGVDLKYVVIAKNGNVALGLYLRAYRDSCRDGKPYSLQGRLRAAAAPGCEATGKEVNDAFKGLPFEKFATDGGIGDEGPQGIVRASGTVTFFTSQQDRQGIPEALAELNIGQKVIDFLTKGIDAKLLVMSAAGITEVVVGEVSKQSAKKAAGLDLAQKIANTDEAFMAKVVPVCEALVQSIETAEAVCAAALSDAKEVADKAAKRLIATHAKKNPGFGFYVTEKTTQEFDLSSLSYDGLTDDSEDGSYDA